jgi:LysR family transcriptional activator of nhaA
VRERYWALTVERKLKHPAVVAITETARTELFGRRRSGTELIPDPAGSRRLGRLTE